ncbi:MAG: 2-C-methyl-D-erythritol 4-phosphate cytidylyltransferase [Oscillospiraceae bacterium]|nr:2-C-methyl-D-erythritol 4-phosphate cytidylyltransferase [Oscillospiraceae bacterium]
MKVSVILAAAGNAERMNGIHKQLAMLRGKPVIAYSMLVFERIEEVSEIIVAARQCDWDIISNIAEENGISKFAGCTDGGETRQQSVINAVSRISADTQLIAVHDAARPLIKAEYIKDCIAAADEYGGAVLGVPVKDTIKTVTDGMVSGTPDRSTLYITQTPQIFRRDAYLEGIKNAEANGLDFTDDCQLVEAVGARVRMVPSDYTNIKITTPEDMSLAETIMSNGGYQ